MVERDPRDPLDEDAAWAEIVASYGEEPAFPAPEDRPSAPVSRQPDAGDDRPVTDLDLEKGLANWEKELGLDKSTAKEPAETPEQPGPVPDAGRERTDGAPRPGAGEGAEDAPPAERPERGPAGLPGDVSGDRPGSSVVFAPGVGPRDWSAAEPSDEDFDEDDEGHFTPPEPPPLPQADVTTKFAWIAVLGGPLLLVLVMIFQWPVTWWITTLGIGGFLGGFATLVARMKDDDDDEPRPGGGAVV
ncbi:hypothetical protein C3486_15020 [Streptomyces sp. Ru73]|uniref:hypothetical protein n=1 Tax=Streptomyces sp. Ru73 TaxID=2080748 RepID=UPI000CDD884D|nr:hypothetical protein [Streptomyces sp. Ru73]POX40108.1 hypothetical protein C3486_15020 [Streptomyces sp. Ru73]